MAGGAGQPEYEATEPYVREWLVCVTREDVSLRAPVKQFDIDASIRSRTRSHRISVKGNGSSGHIVFNSSGTMC
jgi:hypothetical protein